MAAMPVDLQRFFDRDVVLVARQLLGARIFVDGVGGIITETEAYHPSEPASHAHRGPTARNAAMFLGPGHVYIYRIYGLHWCLNFVCSDAAAVLIRAIEPTAGISTMIARRRLSAPRELCSGPGKLCDAMGLSKLEDGRSLADPPFAFHPAAAEAPVVVGPRIGITRAADLPWRFGIAGSAFLSRSFPRPP
ncbi:MAG: DNA-3-methyladenine glycosylase [Devosia sp.]|nr:DNA-3-methyladenine glycosylase [Devosia sp.]